MTLEYDLIFGHTVQNNSEIMDQAEINIYVEDEFWDMVENSPEIDFNGIEQISYQAEKATTAQLVIQMTANPQVKYVYNVNPNSTVFSINVSNLQTGIYNIILICDGKQEDTKKLIIH